MKCSGSSKVTASRIANETLALFGGRAVRDLVRGNREPGVWSVEWDGTADGGQPLRSGVYLVRLEAGSTSETQKIVLVR